MATPVTTAINPFEPLVQASGLAETRCCKVLMRAVATVSASVDTRMTLVQGLCLYRCSPHFDALISKWSMPPMCGRPRSVTAAGPANQ